MTETPLEALVARLQDAIGNSWELDMDIQEAAGMPTEFFGSKVVSWDRHVRGWNCRTEDGYLHLDARIAPNYTASLDAALSLVPEGWFYSCGTGDGMPTRPKIWAQVYRGSHRAHDGNGATLAIALTIACLRARAALPREVG